MENKSAAYRRTSNQEKMSLRNSATATLYLQVGILILVWSCTTDGLSLKDRLELQQLITENDAAKDARLEALELKVTRLEGMVRQQESLLAVLQNERKTNPEFEPTSLAYKRQSAVGKSMFPRTCREVRAADPSLSSGMHWIDPDGQGVGDDPIYVYCDMTKGSTSVLHDSESSINVGHCADPGCYSRSVNYNATLRQIEALAELSNECHQSIRYDCNFAPFEFDSINYSWWNDRNGDPQYFWAGDDSSVHTCQCGIDQNCVDASTTCNCDSVAPVQLTDSGVVTAKSLLPVTRLNFGRTQLETSSGVHTLGRFECSGQVAVNGMPKSCTDLWLIGHTFSGLYLVMGSTQVETVYCDFTKLPDESGFQNKIGLVDVKSSPIYFYVQRNSDFNTTNVPIPFELERLNVGGGMNLASGIFTAPKTGTYFFSSSGIAEGGNLWIGLYVNDSRIGAGYSEAAYYNTFSFESTLRLNAGDKVSLQKYSGNGLLQDDSNHYTHFTGWLLQEDLSSSVFLS